RLADGWLGSQVAVDEAPAAVARIQAGAIAAGRTFDPEHFGLTIIYARDAIGPDELQALRGRRDDDGPPSWLPIGAAALRSAVEGYVAAGLSKFVLLPIQPVGSWTDEAAWLTDAVL